MIVWWLLVGCVPASIWEGRCAALGGRVDGNRCIELAGDTAWDEPDDSEPELSDVAIVFVTEETFDGDLVSLGFGDNAFQVGDFLCQREADSAGLSGTFRVWLSTENKNAVDHVRGDGPWHVRTCGGGPSDEPVFRDREDLELAPLGSLAFTARACGTAPSYVWTGTRTGGTVAPNCNNFGQTFTVDTYSYYTEGVDGVRGDPSNPLEWTQFDLGDCRQEYGLICFSNR